MQVVIKNSGHAQISNLFAADPQCDNIVICSHPYVTTNLTTLKQLGEASIDFDYPSQQFILTRKPNVISADAQRG